MAMESSGVTPLRMPLMVMTARSEYARSKEGLRATVRVLVTVASGELCLIFSVLKSVRSITSGLVPLATP
jgi:hypothetical protein